MNAAGVPWDRIIAAAAASTLGVLSLCVLLVGVLAYLFFGRSDDRIKLAVFGAILLATIGLAIAVLRESKGGASAPRPAPTAVAAGLAPPAAAGVDDVPPPVVAGVPPARTAARAPATAGAAPAGGIDGLWIDADDQGYTYRVTTRGTHFSYRQLLDGAEVGSADGTIVGRDLRYGYVDTRTMDRGVCVARLSSDGDTIEGKCGRWGFRIVRGAG